MQTYIQQCALTLFFYVFALLAIISTVDLALARVRLACSTVVDTVSGLPDLLRWFAGKAGEHGPVLFRKLAQLLKEKPAGGAAEDDAAPEPPPQPAGTDYEQAMETLGFARDQVITRDELKERQRLLMSKLHPDTGFPNTSFAQQVNAAVRTVKKARGWR